MYKILACNIFKRELEELMDKDILERDVMFVEQGLHNTPTKMNESLQELINKLESDEEIIKNYSEIILLYGLCGNGTLGLKTTKLKLIIPRAHDCMTIFLGSKEKYKNIIDSNKGVYWYNHAWIDQTPMPSEKNLELIKEEYLKHYDEDNAEYLYELEVDSLKRYKYGLLIKSPFTKETKYEEFVRDACGTFGWEYKESDSDNKLIENIVKGQWDDDEVLTINPTEEIKLSLDDTIFLG